MALEISACRNHQTPEKLPVRLMNTYLLHTQDEGVTDRKVCVCFHTVETEYRRGCDSAATMTPQVITDASMFTTAASRCHVAFLRKVLQSRHWHQTTVVSGTMRPNTLFIVAPSVKVVPQDRAVLPWWHVCYIIRVVRILISVFWSLCVIFFSTLRPRPAQSDSGYALTLRQRTVNHGDVQYCTGSDEQMNEVSYLIMKCRIVCRHSRMKPGRDLHWEMWDVGCI